MKLKLEKVVYDHNPGKLWVSLHDTSANRSVIVKLKDYDKLTGKDPSSLIGKVNTFILIDHADLNPNTSYHRSSWYISYIFDILKLKEGDFRREVIYTESMVLECYYMNNNGRRPIIIRILPNTPGIESIIRKHEEYSHLIKLAKDREKPELFVGRLKKREYEEVNRLVKAMVNVERNRLIYNLIYKFHRALLYSSVFAYTLGLIDGAFPFALSSLNSFYTKDIVYPVSHPIIQIEPSYLDYYTKVWNVVEEIATNPKYRSGKHRDIYVEIYGPEELIHLSEKIINKYKKKSNNYDNPG